MHAQAEIPFLGKTGPFTVPLICTCKKAKPVLSTDEVIMDNVVRGETEKFTLTITNNGALPTDFTITAVDPDAFAMVADELSFASSGSVNTYNETKVRERRVGS